MKVYRTKSKKLPGTKYSEVYKKAFGLYKTEKNGQKDDLTYGPRISKKTKFSSLYYGNTYM